MDEEDVKKVGLENLDDEALADIVEKELQEGNGLENQTPGYIAFHELAKRSGWA